MKDRKRIIDQLNREERFPAFFRSNDFKAVLLIVLILCFGLALVVGLIPAVWRWVDALSPMVTTAIVCAFLFSFSMWVFFVRRR